jgi:hypothetical protein
MLEAKPNDPQKTAQHSIPASLIGIFDLHCYAPHRSEIPELFPSPMRVRNLENFSLSGVVLCVFFSGKLARNLEFFFGSSRGRRPSGNEALT